LKLKVFKSNKKKGDEERQKENKQDRKKETIWEEDLRSNSNPGASSSCL
jgi:hypothetical protein